MPDEEEVGGDLKYLNHNRSNVIECHMKRGKRDLGKIISKRRIDVKRLKRVMRKRSCRCYL